MYSTPATGTSQNPNDLEDYLLGKRRVDKMLTADENEKLGASHKSFIAVQNANSARDLAAKIREDPLLAIKQQEQAAYQALMANPLRLREMQERNGIKTKKDKKDKKRDKKEKKDKHRLRERSRTRSASPYERGDRRLSPAPDRYSRSRRSMSPRDVTPPSHSRHESRRHTMNVDSRRPRRSPSPDDNDYRRHLRSPSPEPYRRRDGSRERPARDERQSRPWPRSSDSSDGRGRSRSPERKRRHQSRGHGSPDPKRMRYSPPAPPRPAERPSYRAPPPPAKSAETLAEERAAKLAAMTSSASSLTVERHQRLGELKVREEAELAEEERLRAKSKGMGGFLSQEQKKVYGGGLEDRIRRGRGGMVVDTD
ncbi:hypothetical protein FIBSPDRAFT_390870 [Athelia psychrophila]|uniref:CBF1-interacting co-repressor CIR N-terminal domain-containing protein n=1 Tax=Athelia psychrophila TaxID=1759441 RepID=A0A166NW88_9AGAM|nr:hypothetical protein FIBSPDRAFT_390870 [Fibularhizoctonia sp. CBS 109695]